MKTHSTGGITWQALCGALALLGLAGAAHGQAQATPAFEGAGGLILDRGPAFPGSAHTVTRPELAGFVRWGRFTLTGKGGFSTRAGDDVERGLEAELLRREGLRLGASLRYDKGRRESDSNELDGLGDIGSTLRLRLAARWEPAPGWRVGAGLSMDALGRVGGYFADLGVQRLWPLGARRQFALGVNLSGAGDNFMQTWYGISERQAAASGYPTFRAREGLRELRLGASLRQEIGTEWSVYAAAHATRSLGAAADSPLSRRDLGHSIEFGLVRRF